MYVFICKHNTMMAYVRVRTRRRRNEPFSHKLISNMHNKKRQLKYLHDNQLKTLLSLYVNI